MNRRWKTLLIPTVLVAGLLLWYFFGREEARMLRAVRTVKNYSEAESLGAKFNLIPSEWNVDATRRTYQYTYQVNIGRNFQRHHSIGWAFDDNGRVKAYGRATEIQILWKVYWTFEDVPPIPN